LPRTFSSVKNTHVDSDGVSSQIRGNATIAGSPDGVPRTENPQATGGETSIEEDASG